MENQVLLELIQEMAFAGKDYDAIVKELDRKKDQFPPETISFAKRKIDDYIVSFQLANQEKSKGLNQAIMGLVLLLIGVGVTGYTYFGDADQYVLAYGAILAGAWILKEGYKTYRTPVEELVPRRSAFRR